MTCMMKHEPTYFQHHHQCCMFQKMEHVFVRLEQPETPLDSNHEICLRQAMIVIFPVLQSRSYLIVRTRKVRS